MVWVNGRILNASHPKAKDWSPAPPKGRVLWGICECGEPICEGDSVGMWGNHIRVICYTCWMTGDFPDFHCDCAGLQFPDSTLSQ